MDYYRTIKDVIRRMYKVIVIFDHEFDFYDYSLTEGVVIGIIERNPGILAKDICNDIRIDKGHLSRILKKLEDKGVVRRTSRLMKPQEKQIKLTAKGLKLYAELQGKIDGCIGEHMQSLSDIEQKDLINNVEKLEQQLIMLVPDTVNQ